MAERPGILGHIDREMAQIQRNRSERRQRRMKDFLIPKDEDEPDDSVDVWGAYVLFKQGDSLAEIVEAQIETDYDKGE